MKLDHPKNNTTSIEEMITYSTCISNREALKDKIHGIHNYLRNMGAGYGMTALKIFNVFYGLKKISEYKLIDKLKLDKTICDFQVILEKTSTLSDEQFGEYIYKQVLQNIYDSRDENVNVKNLIFYEIPEDIKASVWKHLVKEINDITIIEKSCNVLLSGKIYEYFVGRDQTAISELGAYFTDRHITKYIYDRLAIPLKENGKIGTMIDMFGGSGGFTTGYIDYICTTYPQVDWNTEMSKVYHCDINEDVIKSAGLEFFCLTGVLPNYNNLSRKNAFKDEFVDVSNKPMTFDYVITNPPYGGDKGSTTQSLEKRNKIREYIKKELSTITDEQIKRKREEQLKKLDALDKAEKEQQDKAKVCLDTCSTRINQFAIKHNLKNASDKEACSLILMMSLLAPEGTCCGVLKEGVFFNKTYKELRKVLISNYNVKDIISVPKSEFENTSTKTSIVIFENTTQKTHEVIFRDLVVERYEKDVFEEIMGEIVLLENKGDIKTVCDVIVSQATRDEILKNPNCSLNSKDYNKKEIVCGDDYKLVRLGDLCEFVKGKQLSKANFVSGEYLVIGGGIKPTGYHNIYNMPVNTILCSSSGENAGFISRYNVPVWASDCFAIIPKACNAEYLYHTLHMMQDIIFSKQNGSGQPHVYSKDLVDMLMPIPKSEEKLKEWVEKISGPFDRKTRNEAKLKELEQDVQNKIKHIIENDDCDEVKLGDVVTFLSKKNKYKASDGRNEGIYRFYSSSQDKVLFRDDYEFEGPNILIGRGGVASLHIAYQFSVSHDDVYVLTSNIDIRYIYYSLQINKTLISNSFQGSTIKHSSKGALNEIKMKIPKNKQLIVDLEPIFKEIEELQTSIKQDEALYKKHIQELSDEAIIKEATENNVVTSENIVDPVEITEPQNESIEIASNVSSNSSVKALKEQAKSLGIRGYSKLNKQQLIEKIKNHKV